MAKGVRKNSIIRRIVLITVSVYLLYSLGSLQIQLINQTKEYNEYLDRKKAISQRIDELTRLLESGTESEIIEKAARDRLGYVYSNEQVYIDISGN